MFKQELIDIIKEVIPLPENKLSELLEIPPDHKLGDFAFPCFVLAKELKKAPNIIAEELAQKISEKTNNNFLSEVKNIGPYLNFFIKPEYRAKYVINSKPWSLNSKNNSQKIMIEYPSPNTNKPLHLGHVRNMILGSTLSIILKAAGNNIIQVNLNNDRGIHICKSMLAYKKWGNNASPNKKSDHYVGDWYVKYAQEEAKNPDLKDEAQEMLRKWEAGDQEVVALWKKMNTWAFNGFHETFDKFNIKFDKEYYESQIYKEGKEIILNNINLFEKDEGAVIANLEKFKLPNKVLLRNDGTAIYITQDIALTINKTKEFNPDKQIWVVGNEQNLHFKQLFAILKMLGINEEFYHLSYGMIALPEGRMKSREGKVVDADDLLEEMKLLAISEIKKRQNWPKDKIINTAKKIAMGAIKFFIIKYDPSKDFVFDPNNSLSFEGDTGPYIQYTHARICSILRQAEGKGDPKLLIAEEEQALLRVIEKTPLAFEKAVKELRPNLIANHLLSIGHAFNSFYHACPVLKADEDIKNARLELLRLTKNVIAEGLALLGIEAPEEM